MILDLRSQFTSGADGSDSYCLGTASVIVAGAAAAVATTRGRLPFNFARLCGKESTVSLIVRRPNCMASRDDGVQISTMRPLIAPPVSATTYSPLHGPASMRTRVPRGRCLGSAAIKPRLTYIPLAVRPRRLYAVAE